MERAVRQEQSALQTRESDLQSQYSALIATQDVEWEGNRVPLVQLQSLYWGPKKSHRLHAWRLEVERRLEDREAIASIWSELLRIRMEETKNSGTGNYYGVRREYLNTFDYTLADFERFGAALEEWVSPVLVRLDEQRRQQLGTRSVRPWDMHVDAWDQRQGVYKGPQSNWAPEAESINLDSRIPHAFAFLANDTIPQAESICRTGPFAEAAAYTLDLLTIDAPGARLRYLERFLMRWTLMVMIDAFERWAYQHPDAGVNPSACSAMWRDLWLLFLPGIDWTGLDKALEPEWQKQSLLFLHPCSAGDRAVAHLAAIQFWANIVKDRDTAVRRFRAALSLGSTARESELFEKAGGRLCLDEPTLRDAVEMVTDEMSALEAEVEG
ncbi:MAG: hypothetical protein NVSMB52_00270 [Chloroflexota bacterium]